MENCSIIIIRFRVWFNSKNIREVDVVEVIWYFKNENVGGIDNIFLNVLKFVDEIFK